MQTDIFDAVRRGYDEFETASNLEIINYFDDISPDEMIGHVNNIKGIAFEQLIVDSLQKNDINAELFEATNHPVADISVMTDTDIAIETQLKATDSVSYINQTLEDNSDIPIIATSEVAQILDDPRVIDSGILNQDLTETVEASLIGIDSANEIGSDVAADTIFESLTDVALPISPVGVGLSVIGWFFGLF